MLNESMVIFKHYSFQHKYTLFELTIIFFHYCFTYGGKLYRIILIRKKVD